MGIYKTKIVEQQVDVDIDEYDDEEIIDEIIKRRRRGKFNLSQLDRLSDFFEEEMYDSIPNNTLEDNMKRDWLIEHWGEFTSFDLDNFLKHKK